MSTSSPVPTTRRALHAYVSDAAHSQCHDFAAENGVSVSALLEVLGSHLLQPESKSTPSQKSDDTAKVGSEIAQMVVDARKLDASRRRRNTSS